MRRHHRWPASGALLLASCGGGDNAAPATVPTVTLTASPASVGNASGSTLVWTSANASSCTASGGWSGPLATSGSQSTGALSATATYVVTCTGPGGTSPPASATVSVAATATLTANPTVVAAGTTSTLTWASTGATSCSASGGWGGTLPASGSQASAPLAINTTYSLTCGGAGAASKPASVTVNVVPTAVLTSTATTVAAGSSAVLTWSSTNATACTASGGWSGVKTASGMQNTGALSVPTTFSLVCQGAGGTSNSSSVTIVSGAVVVSPSIAALTSGQPQQFSAAAPGAGAVTWTVDGLAGGNAAVGMIGASGMYVPGTAAGAHAVTATSAAFPSVSGSALAAVTDLSGVVTYHNDLARDGSNSHEFALNPTSVSSGNFGKLFSCSVDGAIYGQPLWVPGLIVNGARHNVIFVATEHDSVYAFDADTSPCTPLWAASLIDTTHGATTGETPVPAGPTGYLVGRGIGDLTPEAGISGTPVIDPGSGTLYAVAKSVNGTRTTFYQRLHAVDLATGREKAGAPAVIAATAPGSGDGGATVAFNPQTENQRAALALVNGVVYISWAAHEDVAPWYGWVIGYAYGTAGFTRTAVFNAAPDAQEAGIWMSGGAPAADAAGNLYLITGNGNYDATSLTAPNTDYGDSLLQLTAGLTLVQSFTPSAQATDSGGDKDFGAGGAAVLADLPAGSPVPHVLICGGKDGTLYVLNRDTLGGFGDAAAVQKITFGYPVYATGAYFNTHYYLSGDHGPLADFALTASVPQITLQGLSSHVYGFGGSIPSVSSAGTLGGVVWTLDNANFCTTNAPGCGPTVLHAHDASNITSELWNSSNAGADTAGNAVKFTVPTVANGRVYVGTRGNNVGGLQGSTSASGELDVYGLHP